MQADLSLHLWRGLDHWGGPHFVDPDTQINFISRDKEVTMTSNWFDRPFAILQITIYA